MVSIGIRFLSGRYHATGWDHHVNEGVPEWPPAPFRILRALTAASYRLEEAPTEVELTSLLGALSGEPEYLLPAASRAHTRHFMPAPEKRTKIFDSFIVVGDGGGENSGEIVVTWRSVPLTRTQSDLLARLVDVLGYLGRAESWVECRLLDDSPTERSSARPLGIGEESEYEVRLLASESPSSYESWRRGFMAARPPGSRLEPPNAFWDVLHTDTGTLQSQGWSSPPGTRWVRYGFRQPPFRSARVRTHVHVTEAKPFVARFSLQSSVLPPLIEAVAIGDRMRQALMAHSRDASGLSHPVFAGRDALGAPLVGQQHAFFLPEDADGDGFLDSIVVWSRSGFDDRAVRALRSVERLWGSTGHELWLLLVGIGRVEHYGAKRGDADRGGSPSLGPARVWRSVTPFVAPRHAKERGGRWIDSNVDQLRRSLGHIDLDPIRIEPLAACKLAGTAIPWYRFRRRRVSGDGACGSDRGSGFEIEFAQPVCGPVVAGYGAHFGLGRFEAVS